MFPKTRQKFDSYLHKQELFLKHKRKSITLFKVAAVFIDYAVLIEHSFQRLSTQFIQH